MVLGVGVADQWPSSHYAPVYCQSMHAVAVLAEPDVIAFDLAIAIETFGRARLADGGPGYRVRVCGAQPVVAAGPIGITTDFGLDELLTADTIIVPGRNDVSTPVGDDVSTAELISRVADGIYIVGDKSWSIDMQRYNFQFTGQRFFRIRDGKLDGQVRDVAYQATTTDFWDALEAVGGPSTWRLGGAFNCGKAQPGQVAAVSHGCPSALFRGINVLNTRTEGGR